MAKTYYIGFTKNRAVVARASGQDYGYTHAAVRGPSKFPRGSVVPLSDASFSTSAAGAIRNATRYSQSAAAEAVELQKVDRETYVNLTGKS